MNNEESVANPVDVWITVCITLDSHVKFIQNLYTQRNLAWNFMRMAILRKSVKPASFYLVGNAHKCMQVNDS